MLKELIKELLADELRGEATSAPVVSSANGTLYKIVICQRGFVYAGDVEFDGEYLVITNAVNLRVWGTTRGLGELALNGPTSDTRADACGVVRVHKLAVVATMDCVGGDIHATT